jgi:hypothetical protein
MSLYLIKPRTIFYLLPIGLRKHAGAEEGCNPDSSAPVSQHPACGHCDRNQTGEATAFSVSWTAIKIALTERLFGK